MTGPDGVESVEPDSPVGGQNLMKASHSHCSPLRSHLLHEGRVSSPAALSVIIIPGRKYKNNTDHSYIHFLRFRRQFKQPERVLLRFWLIDAAISSVIPGRKMLRLGKVSWPRQQRRVQLCSHASWYMMVYWSVMVDAIRRGQCIHLQLHLERFPKVRAFSARGPSCRRMRGKLHMI